jgi:hypothetical protein
MQKRTGVGQDTSARVVDVVCGVGQPSEDVRTITTNGVPGTRTVKAPRSTSGTLWPSFTHKSGSSPPKLGLGSEGFCDSWPGVSAVEKVVELAWARCACWWTWRRALRRNSCGLTEWLCHPKPGRRPRDRRSIISFSPDDAAYLLPFLLFSPHCVHDLTYVTYVPT